MRRKKSFKFHAIAISLICVIVIVLYLLIGPEDAAVNDPNAALGDRYIRMVSASWGLNCNPEVARLRKQGVLTTTEDGKTVPLQPIQPNNVLYTLTERCNEKITCTVLASNEVLELDPLRSCYKQLVVTYRCFSIDRAWRKEVEQGELLELDCHEAADKDRK